LFHHLLHDSVLSDWDELGFLINIIFFRTGSTNLINYYQVWANKYFHAHVVHHQLLLTWFIHWVSINTNISTLLLKGVGAFWQICTFSIFFVLMGNFLPLSNFRIKTFSNTSCHFSAYFFQSEFFQIDYFYFINRSLKKHSKNACLLSKVSKLQ
jgi:hypothetical protein